MAVAHHDSHQTHEVLNQVPPLEPYDAYAYDLPLQEAVRRNGGAWGEDHIRRMGERAGSPEVIQWGYDANNYPPELHTHNRRGERIDEAKFHPAWHNLMRLSVESGVHAMPWRDEQPGSHVVRMALAHLISQVESGHGCPITMTFAAVPALRVQPEVADEWVPRITSLAYDERFLPPGEKRGAIMGMAMTEKQGGSDVRANTTQAFPVGVPGPGQEYLLTGHKWFCSAPMSDAFLTLAHTGEGLSCFIVPRFRPDGSRNNFFIQRLKDKLGNRSNASSEIEYRDTWARMVGEEGRGVPAIIGMVNHTRLDCINGSLALMRQALLQAVHHCTHRAAFGANLVDQPLMRQVLADLCIDWEAGLALLFRVTRSYDDVRRDPSQQAFKRIATAVGKYFVCKSAPAFVYEALECHGGNGYVEEHILARLYREAPLNSIWEGSGNVMCLDVLRAAAKEPETVPAFLSELNAAKGSDKDYDAALIRLESLLAKPGEAVPRARQIVELMARLLQGSVLLREGDAKVAEAFCATRLGSEREHQFGTLAPRFDVQHLIGRAMPAA